MQRFGSAIDLDLRFCIFAIFVLALYYFLGGSWGTLGPSTASEGRVTIHCKYAVIVACAYYAFSTWHFLSFGNLLYYFFLGPGCTRGLPRNFSFRFSSPLNLFASSPLRLLALRKPLFFLFAGFAECLSWFACFCQDSINVSAIWLLWRCYFAVISQKSMNVSANLLTFRFSTNV